MRSEEARVRAWRVAVNVDSTVEEVEEALAAHEAAIRADERRRLAQHIFDKGCPLTCICSELADMGAVAP